MTDRSAAAKKAWVTRRGGGTSSSLARAKAIVARIAPPGQGKAFYAKREVKAAKRVAAALGISDWRSLHGGSAWGKVAQKAFWPKG